jgi:hypothetical protein
MKNEFIPYELAVKLKALGFNEPCLGFYDCERDFKMISNKTKFLDCEVAIPLYQQAFRFFREKHNLVHEISWSKYKGGVSFDYDVFSLVLPTDDELGNEDDIYIEKPMETYDSLAGKSFRDRESDTFEEAELACLVKLIEIVKKK